MLSYVNLAICEEFFIKINYAVDVVKLFGNISVNDGRFDSVFFQFNKLFGFDDGGRSQGGNKPFLMEHTVSTTKSVANSSSTSYLDPIKPASQINPPTNNKVSILSSQMMMNNATNVGANQDYGTFGDIMPFFVLFGSILYMWL